MEKYKITEEFVEYNKLKLYRIEAIIAFANVLKGEKGGFIEKEKNLSQASGNARVSGNTRVSDDAQVSDNAIVSGDARVSGNARMSGEIKCKTGYYFARKEKSWEVKEIKVDDDNIVLWRM